MRIALLGTGAMSCLFAAYLADVADVTLVGTWAEAIACIRRRGIQIEDSGGSRIIAAAAERIGSQTDPQDLVIVLVKSWQTNSVAPYLAHYLGPEGVAVSLQNGLGNLELLGPRAVPGSTAMGATLLGPGHVRAGGKGATHMAAPEWVCDLFRRAGLECQRVDPGAADSLIWGKLMVNCGINALTALLRIPNGELPKRPAAAGLMIRAAMECAEVARARGIRLPFDDPAAVVRGVAEKTAGNNSSMLQDIMRGARTECDAINGAIVAEGKRLGIPTPVNEFLWHSMQALDHQYRSRKRECVQ